MFENVGETFATVLFIVVIYALVHAAIHGQ